MDLSPEKILLVGLIALIVLGPDRLPKAARAAGKMLADIRRFSASVQHEVTSMASEPGSAVAKTASELGLPDIKSLPDIHRAVQGARSSLLGAVNGLVIGPPTPAQPPGAPLKSASLPAARSEPVPDDVSLN